MSLPTLAPGGHNDPGVQRVGRLRGERKLQPSRPLRVRQRLEGRQLRRAGPPPRAAHGQQRLQPPARQAHGLLELGWVYRARRANGPVVVPKSLSRLCLCYSVAVHSFKNKHATGSTIWLPRLLRRQEAPAGPSVRHGSCSRIGARHPPSKPDGDSRLQGSSTCSRPRWTEAAASISGTQTRAASGPPRPPWPARPNLGGLQSGGEYAGVRGAPSVKPKENKKREKRIARGARVRALLTAEVLFWIHP